MLDEYADKLFEQFVSEGGKTARAVVKEERLKIRQEAEAAAAARTQERRRRAERRRLERGEGRDDPEDGEDGNESVDDIEDDLEMVNIVLNRARRRIRENEEESVDTDSTLELRFSEGKKLILEPDQLLIFLTLKFSGLFCQDKHHSMILF